MLTSIRKLRVDRIHLGTALPILQDIVPNSYSCVLKFTLSQAEGPLSTGLFSTTNREPLMASKSRLVGHKIYIYSHDR